MAHYFSAIVFFVSSLCMCACVRVRLCPFSRCWLSAALGLQKVWWESIAPGSTRPAFWTDWQIKCSHTNAQRAVECLSVLTEGHWIQLFYSASNLSKYTRSWLSSFITSTGCSGERNGRRVVCGWMRLDLCVGVCLNYTAGGPIGPGVRPRCDGIRS